MSGIASQITSLTIVYSTVYSDADQRKHQSSATQAFVWGIHRGPVNSPHKWPVTRKIIPFGDVIMKNSNGQVWSYVFRGPVFVRQNIDDGDYNTAWYNGYMEFYMVCALLCFVVFRLQPTLNISFRASDDRPSASEVTLKNRAEWITWIRS